MAIEYFHISESDHDMLEQIMELEQEVHPARGTGLNYFEAHSFIRYGRVYAAVEYDEVLGCAYFLRDFNNPGKCFLYEVVVKPSSEGFANGACDQQFSCSSRLPLFGQWAIM